MGKEDRRRIQEICSQRDLRAYEALTTFGQQMDKLLLGLGTRLEWDKYIRIVGHPRSSLHHRRQRRCQDRRSLRQQLI